MGRIRPGQARRRGTAADHGFTLVEVVLAIAILTVAIAATTAAISLAASARREGGVQVTAAEIANEALQQAEAFGCGLPPDFNGVSAAERLAACDYNGSETGGAALADVDYTTVRNGHSFDVEIRMRWRWLDTQAPDPTYFTAFQHDLCQWRAMWFSAYGTHLPLQFVGVYPPGPFSPSLLQREVTVRAPNGREAALEATEAVRSESADHRWGYMLAVTPRDPDKAVELARYEPNQQGTQVWSMTMRTDTEGCVWFPYLTQPSSDYKSMHRGQYKNLRSTGSFCMANVPCQYREAV